MKHAAVLLVAGMALSTFLVLSPVEAQYLTSDIGVVRECFGLEEIAGCASEGNATALGAYYGESITTASCFESCYEQDDCTLVAYFQPGGLCYNYKSCGSVSYTSSFSDWRLFERIDFSGSCSATEAPASGNHGFVAGGYQNFARGDFSTIGGGAQNIISSAAEGATIGGGKHNAIENEGIAASIFSGSNSSVTASHGVIVGGENHTIAENSQWATILSGYGNQANARYTAVLSGKENIASGIGSVVSGGESNTAGGNCAAIGGGKSNIVRGDYGVGAGGLSTFSTANYATSLGGYNSLALSRFAQVLGGSRNEVRGRFSVAMGFQAQVSGKFSASLSFKNGEICSVTQRKSIGLCADTVYLGDGGLDLVALAEAKTAIGRRHLGNEEISISSTNYAITQFAEALLAKSDRLNKKLASLPQF